jgi:hypothetical protein
VGRSNGWIRFLPRNADGQTPELVGRTKSRGENAVVGTHEPAITVEPATSKDEQPQARPPAATSPRGGTARVFSVSRRGTLAAPSRRAFRPRIRKNPRRFLPANENRFLAALHAAAPAHSGVRAWWIASQPRHVSSRVRANSSVRGACGPNRGKASVRLHIDVHAEIFTSAAFNPVDGPGPRAQCPSCASAGPGHRDTVKLFVPPWGLAASLSRTERLYSSRHRPADAHSFPSPTKVLMSPDGDVRASDARAAARKAIPNRKTIAVEAAPFD